MKNITKKFDDRYALRNVDLRIELGRIYGILGENGAGKSALMKILAGSLRPDFGSIFMDGNELNIRQPVDALSIGIVTIFQDVNLVNDLSVAENLFLGKMPRQPLLRTLDWKQAYTRSASMLNQLGFDIDPKKRISELNYTQKRMVEIAKALANNVRILIVDEAYVGNSEYEQKNFLQVLRRLNTAGVTILYISHNIDEVLTFCDRFIIMKGGSIIMETEAGAMSRDDMIRAVVGGVIKKNFPRIINENKRMILKIANLKTRAGINDITFKLYKGEILGVAGLIGSGRTAIARVLFGLDKILRGSISMNDSPLILNSPADAIRAGFGYMPEDMLKESLYSNLSVSKNITMANLKDVSKAFIIDQEKEFGVSASFIKRLLIRTPSLKEQVSRLSQGNQQKVHLSKWIHANCKILILDEPTNGIDLATRVDIYNFMNNFVLKGNSIILISSNLEELIGMSDRIIVLREGTVVSTLERQNFSKEIIMQAATRTNETTADPELA